MDNLYILTKQEFTSLYRFGKIPVIQSKIVTTKNRNVEEINEKIYEEFLSLPYFVGDEEYLIISFENILLDNIWLEIENVTEIIPLTRAAKNSFQMKFDNKLNFKDARFENIIHKVEEHIDIQERYSGAKAFWNLCQVKSKFEPLIPNELIEFSYFKRINGVKSSEFKADFFVHLLAYDRYEFFPNSDLGFFYDIGEVFAHTKGLDSFKGSSFHSFLEKYKHEFSDKTFVQIAQIISESEEIRKFTEHLTHNGLKQYLASALFLKFKNDLIDRDTIKESHTGKLISEIRKNNQYIDELNLAIYLTGSFFGYQKFYDDLYELVNLRIFKGYSKPNIKKVIVQEIKDELTSKPELLATETNEGDDTPIEIVSNENSTVNEKIDNTENPTTIPEELESPEISKIDDVKIVSNENPVLNEKIDNTENSITIAEELGNPEILKVDDEVIVSIENPIQNEDIDSTKNSLLNDKIEKNEIIDNVVIQSSTNETSRIKIRSLEMIFKILDEEKGKFELKSDRNKELKKILSPLSHKKNISTKDDVIEIIIAHFSNSINTEKKGDKFFISRKPKGDLFATADIKE